MTIKDWIDSADGYYKTARFLENPVIEVQYKIDSIKSSWYLLHHSLELYLKAILMNYDKYSKTDTKIHNLTELLNMVDGLNPKIDEKLKKVVDNRSIKQWISFINPFGYPNGGIRYMQKGKSMYATPLGISYFFNELIDVINSECNQEKEIDELV